MKVQTDLFGDIEVLEYEIINFPEGLLGLEGLKEFVLLNLPENPYFKWLQSVQEKSLALLLVNPFQFISDYEFDLFDIDKEFLAVEKVEDLIICTTVSIPENDLSKMTTNLLGPIVINTKNKKGKQLVLADRQYSTKVTIFNEVPTKEACK